MATFIRQSRASVRNAVTPFGLGFENEPLRKSGARGRLPAANSMFGENSISRDRKKRSNLHGLFIISLGERTGGSNDAGLCDRGHRLLKGSIITINVCIV